jgi:predicted nucleotidyltransferase
MSVVEALQTRPWVVAAWLYGSRAVGRARPDSDWDVALLVTGEPGWDSLQELREELEDGFGGEVSLAILNRAENQLCREAIFGQSLYCRDAEERACFVSRVCRLAQDDDLRLRQSLAWWKAAHSA